MTPDPSESVKSNDFEQVKLLFEYTKFHLGVYTTLAAALIALVNTDFGKRINLPGEFVWAAVIFIGLAGLAGGIVASTLPHVTTLSDFWSSKIGPFRLKILAGEGWTYIEHTAFWLAIVSILTAFALRYPAPTGAQAVQPSSQIETGQQRNN